MKIKIAERLKPFSHEPGTRVILPGSTHVIEAFPTMIKVADRHFPLEGSGPVKGFTVQLDLEKGCIWVWGTCREGYRRYCLWSEGGEFRMAQVRGDQKVKAPYFPSEQFERLSLGSHKKQDWCLVRRRGDLKEIIPHWIRLGQLIIPIASHKEGALGFLHSIPFVKETLGSDLLNLFYLGFNGIFNPQLQDPLHLGLSVPPVEGEGSPLALIKEGAQFLRSLFIQVNGQISILPCLLSAFHCGRFVHVNLGKMGKLHFEWSKKMVRRLIFESAQDQKLLFLFPKEAKRFRLRRGANDRGEVCSAGLPLAFETQSIYYFDRFQK